MSHVVNNKKTEIEIVDEDYNHSLTIENNPRELGINQGLIYINQPLINSGVIVTSRDHTQYPREVRNLRLNPNKQYVEIGAGLGGFIPNLVTKLGGRLNKKPIVIDIVEYDVVHRLFETGIEEAYNRKYHQKIINRLATLRDRAEFYSKSLDIRLISMPLGQALDSFPDLVGCADVVIDNFGAAEYPQIEFGRGKTNEGDVEKIKAMRELLLKKKGIILGS